MSTEIDIYVVLAPSPCFDAPLLLLSNDEQRLAVRDHALLHLSLQTSLCIGEAAALLIQDLLFYGRDGSGEHGGEI